MKISEIAKQTGLSVPTIRYYEKVGLCPAIKRGNDGTREFSAVDLDWFVLLASLRETGMPNTEMMAFASLYERGNETIADRKAMLLSHQKRLAYRQQELDRCAEILRKKISIYDEIIGASG